MSSRQSSEISLAASGAKHQQIESAAVDNQVYRPSVQQTA
jgi:hypothetical protein